MTTFDNPSQIQSVKETEMTYDDSNRIPVNRTILARFFSKIQVSVVKFFNNSPCWEWTAAKNIYGYGISRINGVKTQFAHRLVYGMFVELAPDHLVCDHLCRNRACMNPAHIELTSPGENVLRGEGLCAQNKEKTHCKRGHPFDPSNTYWKKTRTGIGRRCRQCHNEGERSRRLAKPAV